MAGTKELRTQIRSIKSTQKITSAMEMVAASKMRKAQDRMFHARPYSESILRVIGHIANAHPEYKHPFLEEREVKRVGFILISSDRGLCGGLNINLFKAAISAMKEWHEKNIAMDLCVFGNKGDVFFNRHGGHIIASHHPLGDTPSVANVIGPIKIMLDAYHDRKIDRLFIGYNKFVSTMVQKPLIQQLLP